MNIIETIRDHIPKDYFTSIEVEGILDGTDDQRYGLIKRALRKGDLIQVRRGLYCLRQKYRRDPLNLFVLAERIYGPSYISLESALMHHQLIPEHVPVVTACTCNRSRQFRSPLGLFAYHKVPKEVMLFDVHRVEVEGGKVLIASPWKAICDFIYVNKKEWVGSAPLVDSLRIEPEQLTHLPLYPLSALSQLYRSRRVSRFVHSIEREHEK
jgi:predicted transcriptional regulator of viral defense system